MSSVSNPPRLFCSREVMDEKGSGMLCRPVWGRSCPLAGTGAGAWVGNCACSRTGRLFSRCSSTRTTLPVLP